jgi:hypothetical protein
MDSKATARPFRGLCHEYEWRHGECQKLEFSAATDGRDEAA